MIPGTIVYFNANGSIQVLIQFPVSPNKAYDVQVTTDGINYTTIFSFTAVPQQGTYSWTVTPVQGALWPRLVQK